MRDEVWEYPLEAVREVVINMIVHRDYREAYDSTIEIFDDRIEFNNPGPLPDGLSLKDILSGRTPSRPRNKQIASIFKESGVIEKYGSGIKRVRRIMSESGAAEPLFESMSHHFKVTLFPITAQANAVNESSFGSVNYVVDYSTSYGGLSGDVRAVYDFIRSHPGLRSTQICQALFLKQRTLERYLRKLKDENLINFEGPPKTGGYYPINVLYGELS